MADARTARLQLFTVIVPEPEARTARLQLFTIIQPGILTASYASVSVTAQAATPPALPPGGSGEGRRIGGTGAILRGRHRRRR